jgi:uncharacterized YigZ family protein
MILKRGVGMSEYIIPAGYGEAEYVDKKSRFIGQVQYARTEAEAMAFVESVRKKYADATHNVWAYVLNSGAMRWSDDGEPGGTSGQPTLNVFRSAGVSDVCCVVTRYFGGILLGSGGLVRAYTAAASGALQQAEIVSMRLVTDCAVTVPYPKFEQAQRMITAAGAKLQEPEYADAVTLRWRMPAGTEEALCHDLSELTRGSAEVTISKPLYAAF